MPRRRATASVQYGTNAVTFNDGTDAGSNTIQSETINFGDGSPVATITPGSSVMHTYASPNDYTATITVTYSNGQVGAGPQTATASTPVDITA
jgi:PKD repeat protein